MAQQLSRTELHSLVWSEPMRTLSASFGISDVALKKTCARAKIPTPRRGYWAKKEAGKNPLPEPLPERPPGMAHDVLVAAGRNPWQGIGSDEELLSGTPKPPEFPEPIGAAREQIAKVLGQLTVPRKITKWHPAIDRLLKDDNQRREKQLVSRYPMPWDVPLFDTSFEQRRLRILNTLFLAAARMQGKPSINDREARSIHFTFYRQHVGVRLARSNPARSGQRAEPGDVKLCLSILENLGSDKARIAWQDNESRRLEGQITEIAIQLILTAEQQYRESAIRQYQWRLERKAELENEAKERRLKAESAEHERRKRLEQARTDRLLKDATAFEQAIAIRKYVEDIRLAPSSHGACSPEELQRWSQWALAEADRIDPAVGGRFLAGMKDDDDS